MFKKYALFATILHCAAPVCSLILIAFRVVFFFTHVRSEAGEVDGRLTRMHGYWRRRSLSALADRFQRVRDRVAGNLAYNNSLSHI